MHATDCSLTSYVYIFLSPLQRQFLLPINGQILLLVLSYFLLVELRGCLMMVFPYLQKSFQSDSVAFSQNYAVTDNTAHAYYSNYPFFKSSTCKYGEGNKAIISSSLKPRQHIHSCTLLVTQSGLQQGGNNCIMHRCRILHLFDLLQVFCSQTIPAAHLRADTNCSCFAQPLYLCSAHSIKHSAAHVCMTLGLLEFSYMMHISISFWHSPVT